MNRGSFSSSSSSPDAGLVESPRRGRSVCHPGNSGSSHRDVRASRSSVISSAVLPYLRRLDIGDSMPALHKDPLLVFKLSSPSFLDSQVKDDVSQDPLYTIKTNGTRTTVLRSDPWHGQTTTAEIEWPILDPSKGKGKQLDSVTIQIRSGRRKPADTFLRPGSILSAPRKFMIPGYSHALKWKAVGSSYWCLASSAKGPIAILEPAVEAAPPRLKVFETLHDKYATRPMMVHHGVSILLLDYLLISSLLMTTDIQEWMLVAKPDRPDTPSGEAGADHGPRSAPPAASTSASQWRKIIYGEPLFPKRQSSASAASALRFPIDSSRMAKYVYGDSIYPTLSSDSLDFSASSDSESDSEDASKAVDVRVEPPSTPRAPSPSAESVLYPLTPASAPSHTYLDPSFYNEYGVPPVPPLPAQYASSSSGSSPAMSPSRPSSSRRPRELPRPPSQQGTSHRSRSSPPRPRNIETTGPIGPLETQSAVSSPDRRRPSVDSVLSRTASLRTLPRPPPSEGSSSHPPLRHSQSSTRPLNTREKRSSQYTQRTLPPTPVSGSQPDWISALRIRKRSHNELSSWFANEPPPVHDSERRRSLFEALDCPPPAYNSIEYAEGTSLSISPTSSLSPPPPPMSPPLAHNLQGISS